MEGACVYINKYDKPVLVMYKEIRELKEINNNVIFIVRYSEKTLDYGYINDKNLTVVLPTNCIHILTCLPYLDDIYETLNIWKILAVCRLNSLNNKIEPANNIKSDKNSIYRSNNKFESFQSKFSTIKYDKI